MTIDNLPMELLPALGFNKDECLNLINQTRIDVEKTKDFFVTGPNALIQWASVRYTNDGTCQAYTNHKQSIIEGFAPIEMFPVVHDMYPNLQFLMEAYWLLYRNNHCINRFSVCQAYIIDEEDNQGVVFVIGGKHSPIFKYNNDKKNPIKVRYATSEGKRVPIVYRDTPPLWHKCIEYSDNDEATQNYAGTRKDTNTKLSKVCLD